MKPEPCTSWTHKKRHLSVDLLEVQAGGRTGRALCLSGGVVVNVFDETSINRQLAPYRNGKPSIVVADLPLCRSCERTAVKLETS